MDDLKSSLADLSPASPGKATDQAVNKPSVKIGKTPPPPSPTAPPPPPLPSALSSKPAPPRVIKAGKTEPPYPPPPPPRKSSKKKLATIALTFLIIVFGGISILTAWKLRQVERVTPEEGKAAVTPHNFTSADWVKSGAGAVLKTTHSNYETTVGPGPIDFVASGFGMRNHTSGNIKLEIPDGATVEKVFAFWGGNKSVGRCRSCNRCEYNWCECRMENMPDKFNVDARHAQVGIGSAGSRTIVYPDKWKIWVHDNAPRCCLNNACFDCDRRECGDCEEKQKDPLFQCAAYSHFIADVTNEINQKFPAGTTVFNINIGDMYFNSDVAGGGGFGIGIILIYRKEGLPESKIKIKHWGQFVLRAKTDKMTFNVSDINTDVSDEIKAVFFFSEAEAHSPGEGAYAYRPNYLYYNGQILNPIGGRYVAYSMEDPYSDDPNVKWWDTRISGVNLDKIVYKGAPLEFEYWSPNKGQGPDPTYMGDSTGLVGAAVKYITGVITTPTPTPTATPTPTPTPTPGPLVCLSLESEPEPIDPGDEITLTCTGRSDPALPIDHFEFRVSSNSDTPVPLPTSAATKINGEWTGTTIYEVPDYACYNIECRACRSSDSSECTDWGQAE